MKANYLEELKQLLEQYQIDRSEITDILDDYSDMYENWVSTGMTEDEVEDKLGKPGTIIRDLTDGVRRKPRKKKKTDKIIAVMPFVSLILFLVIGAGWNLWEYSWMAFLLIPVVAIVMEQGVHKGGHMLTAVSPFFAVVVYLILGFVYDLWHPGWMIFLLIPVTAILQSRKGMKLFELLVALSPFIALITFFILGEQGYWQTAWLVFLIIPIFGLMNDTNRLRAFVAISLLLIGVAAYLYIGYTYDEWMYALLGFVPAVIYLIAIGDISIGFIKAPKEYKIVIALAAITFLAIGLTIGYWHLAWLAFLAIPVYAITTEVRGRQRIIALMPFIALVTFFLVGFLFEGFAYAWVAFLLIPVTAIIVNE